jgi:hypothetical protein
MVYFYTTEKLLALEPARLEQVRQNAVRHNEQALADRCAEIQLSRRSSGMISRGSSKEPVVGFHFVCKGDYEVIPESDGTFRSGVWAIDSDLCDPAIELGGYVALHENKQVSSYRQGRIIAWNFKERTKGSTSVGVEFQLLAFQEPIRWYRAGAGERGYRRVTDEPRWTRP